MYARFQTGQMNSCIELSIFELILAPTFVFSQFCLLGTVPNLVPNFILNNFTFLNKDCPKSVFPIKNKTNEYYHQIQLFQISFNLLTFTLNRQFQYFEPIFPKKDNSSPKTGQINIFIKFSIFGLVWVLSLTLNRQCWLF